MSENAKIVPFFKDRAAVLLVTLNGLLALGITLSVFARLRSHDFKVPVQYVVNDGSVLQTSQWFTLYSIVLFAIAGTVGVVILAERLHRSAREFALVTLGVLILTLIFGLFATNALLTLVSQV